MPEQWTIYVCEGCRVQMEEHQSYHKNPGEPFCGDVVRVEVVRALRKRC